MAFDEERCIEWLERLDIPIEESATIGNFQDYLREVLAYGDAQIDALSSVYTIEREFEEVGIHAVMVTFPWGKQLRYGISEAPGLWGFRSAQRFYEERIEETE